ncbi:type VII secretion protein EccE [Actinoplanes lutulentus]|nr:type VII secretion protein EccE [Actinoplanes lutulentus]MBB2945060.1 type VII secretion protein EccE [Actinoplanes lutulentus]
MTGQLSVRSGRLSRVPMNQLVATQAAAVLMLLGAAGGGLAVTCAACAAAGLLTITWVRVRGRWVFEWLGLVARFAARRHIRALGDPPAILALVAPRTRLATTRLSGAPAAVLIDDLGLTTLVELPTLPRFDSLDLDPAIRLQLVLTGVPATTARAGPAAISYRSLSRGDPLARFRMILAIRALRQGTESDEDLRRALTAAIRKLRRELGTSAAGPLTETALVRVIAELAHAEAGAGLHETWTGLAVGGLAQVTFRCTPEPGAGISARLISRLLHLPATATTVALTFDPPSLLVRVAAPTLDTAIQDLGRLLASERMTAQHHDGEQLAGLAATLPLATASHQSGPSSHGLALPVINHGLMLGRSRQGRPVLIRPFRPEPTRMVLVGTTRCAQLIAFRALAVGARVLVSTDRPAAWAPLLHGLDGDESLRLLSSTSGEPPAGSPLRPVLLVQDSGAPGIGVTLPWVTTLTVLEQVDAGLAASADLLLLQPLTPDEAASLGPALALGETAGLLTRMSPGTVAVVTTQAVRWAALTPTSVEKVLIGQPARILALQRNKRQISI